MLTKAPPKYFLSCVNSSIAPFLRALFLRYTINWAIAAAAALPSPLNECKGAFTLTLVILSANGSVRACNWAQTHHTMHGDGNVRAYICIFLFFFPIQVRVVLSRWTQQQQQSPNNIQVYICRKISCHQNFWFILWNRRTKNLQDQKIVHIIRFSTLSPITYAFTCQSYSSQHSTAIDIYIYCVYNMEILVHTQFHVAVWKNGETKSFVAKWKRHLYSIYIM